MTRLIIGKRPLAHLLDIIVEADLANAVLHMPLKTIGRFKAGEGIAEKGHLKPRHSTGRRQGDEM
jgi:hypothetical protein